MREMEGEREGEKDRQKERDIERENWENRRRKGWDDKGCARGRRRQEYIFFLNTEKVILMEKKTQRNKEEQLKSMKFWGRKCRLKDIFIQTHKSQSCCHLPQLLNWIGTTLDCLSPSLSVTEVSQPIFQLHPKTISSNTWKRNHSGKRVLWYCFGTSCD